MASYRAIVVIIVLVAGCRSTPKGDDRPPPPAPAPSPTPALKIEPEPPAQAGQWRTPAVITPGQDLVARFEWKAGSPATLRHPIPDGVQLLSSEPPARIVGRDLVWDVPAGSGSIGVVYRPARVAPIELSAELAGQPPVRQTVRVGVVRLELKVTGPTSAVVGSPVTYEARVFNAGHLAAENVVLNAELDEGLDHPSAGRAVGVPLGTLRPGDVRTLSVTANVKSPGRLRSVARVSAEGAETVVQEVFLDSTAAKLMVELTGPEQLLVGETGTWVATVTNRGTAPAPGVIARIPLPTALQVESVADGGRVAGDAATWTLGAIPPATTRTISFTAVARSPLPRTSLIAAVTVERGAETRSDRGLIVIGIPRLKFDVATDHATVDVGKSAIATVTLRNTGSKPLDDVELAIETTTQLKPVFGAGPTFARVSGSRVEFDRVRQLAPGQTLEFKVELEGLAAGDGRIRAVVRSTTLSDPMEKEQACRVVGPAK